MLSRALRSGTALGGALFLAFGCGGEPDDNGSDAGGAGGSSGSSGSAGVGQGGSGGTAQGGSSGTSGSAGKGGASGTGGSAGKGGSSGAAGTAGGGASGTSGSAGASGGSAGMGGTGAAGGGTGGAPTGGAAGSSGSAGSGGGPCASDTCPFASGVSWECNLRFMYGVNFAWQNFAADFGGWGNQRGVAANLSPINSKLQNWSSNGVNVIRWWVWPDFRGDGVRFSGSSATGLGTTTLADLAAALELAEQHDVYLMLTLFSFDGFKSAAERVNMSRFATNQADRSALIANAIRPFARAVEASPNARRMIAWDVINEPEWSISGSSLYGGDPVFDPQDNMQTVSHQQMETLLGEVIAGLRAESSALVTVGAAAMKWKNAWSRLDLDFHQFHIYDWVHQNGWPYNRTPAQYGVNDKPVVMGEFPPSGVGGANYRTLVDYWYANGYGGSLVWQDSSFVVNYANVKSFADAHACETQY